MKTAQEYRRYAEECRALARSLTGDQRETVLAMVTTWERLAEERDELIANQESRTFSA